MDNKRHKRPSFIGVVFLLQTKNVNGITKSTSDLEMGCYPRGGFIWSFIRFTSPLFSWYAPCSWWRVRFLVVPFPPCGPPLLGYLLAWTLVLAPCSFFLSLILHAFFLWNLAGFRHIWTFELNIWIWIQFKFNWVAFSSSYIMQVWQDFITFELLNSTYEFEYNSNSIKLHSVQFTLCKFTQY